MLGAVVPTGGPGSGMRGARCGMGVRATGPGRRGAPPGMEAARAPAGRAGSLGMARAVTGRCSGAALGVRPEEAR